LGNVYASELTLAVANSTCNVIKQVGAIYAEKNNIGIKYLCKSSGRLAKGIKGKAIKADIYLSANQEWMDYIVDSNLIMSDTIVSPWGNSLVIAAPVDSPLELTDLRDLTQKKIKTVLIGDPGTAPFGRYAKQAMQSSAIWDAVKKKVVTQKHITLLSEKLTSSDPHTVGVLFSTNLNSGLKVILSIDSTWHKPIKYYLAPLKNNGNPNHVNGLINFLQEEQSLKIFQSAGFSVREK